VASFYRDKLSGGVFVRFSCAADTLITQQSLTPWCGVLSPELELGASASGRKKRASGAGRRP
jgi:hypothetical protein